MICEVKGCNKEVDGIISIGGTTINVCSPEHMEIRLKEINKSKEGKNK